ncbi:xanthine dehydrogenase family protein molybdopterin-binding subunit [Sulfurisphaera ohwakuensis]|uniref:Carbon-monoxide dehydrogenase large subunit n=1 Tax=Sulfurisphaera ohwakuensis TaxID=69656 RepID=A0A650CG20_SULOH|nr:xanthine dehydrogenase family protein [Sulfurisphaera ohwakuensis]MBB5254193.1 carbon-monoxide dehydrogenase large subunit [Sulfurisphaera ohwakuensis]QGR16794.1 molybdopterin-dependent oxidoreductase [Sulfurisphaera ohwakuensis]
MLYYYVDDIRGKYKVVSFIRSNKPYAKFNIRGKVYTWKDINFTIPKIFDNEGKLKEIEIPLLAKDRALYIGQPLGMVIGEDEYDAEDKKEGVEVEYEDLTGPIYEPDNVVHTFSQGDYEFGENSFSLKLTFNRQSPAPLEGRGVIVTHEDGRLIIRISTQAPTVVRKIVSEMLDLPEEKIEIKVPRVGGGFGAKQDIVMEELAVIALSYVTGENLKWIERKSEHIMTSQGRGQQHDATVYYNTNGKITGIIDNITYDMGAFPLPWSGISPLYVTLMNLKNVYDIKIKTNVKVVASNSPPQGAFRGFGRPEAFFVIERIMDEVSRRVKIDPISIRERNLGKINNDIGDVKMVLKRLREKYNEYREKYKVGIGISLYLHYASPTSKVLIGEEKSFVGGYECVSLRLTDTGIIEVRTTTVDMGQGISDVLREIVKRELDYDRIVVYTGSQDVNGFGSWASRSVITAGNATLLAARELKEKIDKLGGIKRVLEKLNNSPWELEEKELYSIKCYEPEESIGAISAQISVVEYDGTNFYLRENYIIIDIGVPADVDKVKGQLIGGIVQALGGVLYENVNEPYNYLIPTAKEAPRVKVELLNTPSSTPGGFRGVGENSISGAYASIANAISDFIPVYEIPMKRV